MDQFISWYQNPAPARRSYSRSPSFFGVSVYHVDQTRENPLPARIIKRTPAEKKSGPKIVRIPVQSSGSDSNRRSESALKIQKVFRGFRVRKSVGKIKEIKSQVDVIEAKLLRSEVVEMIRGSEKERLRMNENLMNLLFKLDGIGGVDLGVRVLRKGVTRKAIELQERIDSIVAANIENADDANVEIVNLNSELNVPCVDLLKLDDSIGNDSAAETVDCEIKNLETSDCVGEILSESREEIEFANSGKVEDEKMEIELDQVKGIEETEVTCDVKESEETHNENVKGNKEKDNIKAGGEGEGKNDNIVDNEVSSKVMESSNDDEVLGDSSVEEEAVEVQRARGEAEADDVGVASEVRTKEETCVKKRTPIYLGSDEDKGENVKKILVENNGKKDKIDAMLLEKMTEDNMKMMKMMTHLFERNEQQLQMLDALANRVNYLEKAYVCDKLRNRRKKKKNNNKVTPAAFYMEE